jgi:hypothetical protein
MGIINCAETGEVKAWHARPIHALAASADAAGGSTPDSIVRFKPLTAPLSVHDLRGRGAPLLHAAIAVTSSATRNVRLAGNVVRHRNAFDRRFTWAVSSAWDARSMDDAEPINAHRQSSGFKP